MPGLTRRRNLEAPDECWHIFYGDVRVGTIALRTGIPHHEQPWGWACGFYPGCHPSEYTDGTAETFDQARAEFETAWRMFLSNRTEADFQEWRDQRFGPLRNIGASIGMSLCRLTGAQVANRGWKRRFEEPIPLPRGRRLVTLRGCRQLHYETPESRGIR